MKADSAHLRTPPRVGAGLGVIAVLSAMIALSAAAIDICLPVIPSMVESLRASHGAGQGVVTAYLAGFAIGQIPIGLAADRWGRRNTILAAMIAFIGCSVIVSNAADMNVMLGARSEEHTSELQ